MIIDDCCKKISGLLSVKKVLATFIVLTFLISVSAFYSFSAFAVSVSSTSCWSYTANSTCSADASCQWKADYWNPKGYCQELSCWSLYSQSECSSVPISGKNCTWKPGKTYNYCAELSCWSFQGTNQSACENNTGGKSCQWNNQCYSNGAASGANCYGISSESTCKNTTGCGWGTCGEKGCWSYNSQSSCTAGKDWRGSNCTWSSSGSYCKENNCWDSTAYPNQSACGNATGIKCEWKNNYCQEKGCWSFDFTNASVCVNNTANLSCTWSGNYCNKASCWDFNTQSGCTGKSGCSWQSTVTSGWCEEVQCWSYNSYNGGNQSTCENNTYGLRCKWTNQTHGGNSTTGWCDQNLSAVTCSNLTSEKSCIDSFYCWWNYNNFNDLSQGGTCKNPEWGGTGFANTTSILNDWNPGCYIFDTNSTACNLTIGCNFSTSSSKCLELSTDIGSNITKNGITCSSVNDSELCNNIAVLSSCCTWSGGNCTANKLSNTCFTQLAQTPGGEKSCDDADSKSNCDSLAASPWYWPCKWDNSSSTAECVFKADSVFGNESKSLIKIENKKTCEAAGGKWVTENYCEGNSSIPSGRCEYKFDEEENCDKACFACEMKDSSGNRINSTNARDSCVNSKLGFCEFEKDSKAPNAIGFCKASLEFKQGIAGDCDTSCGDCGFKGDPKNNDTTKRPSYFCGQSKANSAGGGCKWITDNQTDRGGYCIKKGEKTCEDSCDRCKAQEACTNLGRINVANTSGSCKWSGSENEGSCVANSAEDVEICWNGIDDNDNGLTDCMDAGCYSDSFCGFVEGDCFGWQDNTSCITNSCDWVSDKWGSWCDFKGANCWKFDSNASGCSNQASCEWSNGTGSGWCEQDWSKQELCFGKNLTTCTGNCSWTKDTWCDSNGKDTDWCTKSGGGWCDHVDFKPKNCWQSQTKTGCTSTIGCGWQSDVWSKPGCEINYSANCYQYSNSTGCSNSGCYWNTDSIGGHSWCSSNLDRCWNFWNNKTGCEAISGCTYKTQSWGSSCEPACFSKTSSSDCTGVTGCIWKDEGGWCNDVASAKCFSYQVVVVNETKNISTARGSSNNISETISFTLANTGAGWVTNSFIVANASNFVIGSGNYTINYTSLVILFKNTTFMVSGGGSGNITNISYQYYSSDSMSGGTYIGNSQNSCQTTDGCRWKNPGWCSPKGGGFSAGASAGAGGAGGTTGSDCYKYDGNQSLCTNKTAINITCGWTTNDFPFCSSDWSKECWRYDTNASGCAANGCWFRNNSWGSYCMNANDQCWNNDTIKSNSTLCNLNANCYWTSWNTCDSRCGNLSTSGGCAGQAGCKWDSGWCDPGSMTKTFEKMEAGAAAELALDTCPESGKQASVDMCGFGMKDMDKAYGVGTKVYDFTNSSVCNKEKVKTLLGAEVTGAGNDTVRFIVYLDSDGTTSQGCALDSNESATGYEFKFTYDSVWNATKSKAIETFGAYKCDNSKWTLSDAKLTAWKKAMCFDIGGPMIGIDKAELSKFPTLYDSTKDFRIYVATIGNSGNASSPADTSGPVYTTPGSVDFEINDAFAYGADAAKNEDILKTGFVSYEDCFNGKDDNNDNETDCYDFDCKYATNCIGKGVNLGNYTDTKSPQVSGVKIEEYPDAALIMYDTNKPANGTLQFYKNDSKCSSLNATINDIGITSVDVRDYKVWHTANVYNETTGFALTNETTYFFKLKVCDDVGKCALSKCSNFTTSSSTKCGFCNFVARMKAPIGWNISYDTDRDGTYEHLQGQVCGPTSGMKANYTLGRNVNIKLTKSDGTVYFEFINASLSKTGLNDKVRSFSDSGDILFNSTRGLAGLPAESRDKIVNNLHPTQCRMKIPATSGTACTKLYHCDDDGNNCVDKTSEATLLDSTNCVWKLPYCEFSTYSTASTAPTTTTTTTTTTSSGGGGGGGGGGAAEATKKSAFFDSVSAGSNMVVKSFHKDLGLKEITITVNNKVSSVTITIDKVPGKPADVSNAAEGKVYKYLSINKTFDSTVISNVKLEFQVEKTWITSNSIDENKVYLYRYTTKWDKLSTTKTDSNSTHVTYSATSPGLSYFAVSGESSDVLSCSDGAKRCYGSILQQCSTNSWKDKETCVNGCDSVNLNCKIQTTTNLPNACGNNVVDAGEECDGNNLNLKSCQDLGYYGGSLSCSSDCKFDISSCSQQSETSLPIPESVKPKTSMDWVIVLVVLALVVVGGYFYYKKSGKKSYSYKK